MPATTAATTAGNASASANANAASSSSPVKRTRTRKAGGNAAAAKAGAGSAAAASATSAASAPANAKKVGSAAAVTTAADGATAKVALPVNPIALGEATRLPAVFTKDMDYFCVASASSIKIHSRTTGEVVSTLSASDASSGSHTAAITGLILHPHNPLQLITSSLDGTVKVWDYLDAVLLRSIDVGYPVTHLAAHATLPDAVFVAARKPKSSTQNTGSKPNPFTFVGPTNSIIYSVSLSVSGPRPASGSANGSRRPRELLRLGKTREAAGLQVSPDGKWLVAIGNRKVQVARTSALREGFTKFASDERLVSLAFHPTEPTFATGDAAGRIRLWPSCLDEQFVSHAHEAGQGGEKVAPSTVLHWHAHAVHSLAFTPNGAALLSGGEEAVLVVWQLNNRQKEFVPRLGAPISSIAVADGMDGREQEFVLGLADGSVMFIGALNLKPTRTFARIKFDPSRQLLSPARLATIPSPLAIEPCTRHIVMASGHPSTLQFFDADNDRIAAELEVAPSNRVSRPQDAPLEPTRIECVAFSSRAPEGGGLAEWMATIDSRQGGSLTSDLALKFWRYDAAAGRYILNTRVDKPHEGGVTSMSFSPDDASSSSNSSDDDSGSLLFVTTGQDKKIKTWRIGSHAARGGRRETYWLPRSVFGYRETVPTQACWSPDGSLLAVAQGPFVTLWEPTTNALTAALSCPEIKSVKLARFFPGKSGSGGRYLALASGKTLVVWDLVRGAVGCHKTFDEDIEALLPVNPGNAAVGAAAAKMAVLRHTAVMRRSATVVDIFDAVPLSTAPSTTYRLPFTVRETTAMLSSQAHRAAAPPMPHFVAITDKFDVLEVGAPRLDHGEAGPSSSSRSRSAQAAGATAQSLRSVSIKRRTLFDDLFGPSSSADFLDSTSAAAPTRATVTAPKKDIFALFDAPSHLLPPVGLLFDSFVDCVLPPSRGGSGGAEEEAQSASASGKGKERSDAADGGVDPDADADAEMRGITETRARAAPRSQEEDEEELAYLTGLFARSLATGGAGSGAGGGGDTAPADTPKLNGTPKVNGRGTSAHAPGRSPGKGKTSASGEASTPTGTPRGAGAGKKRKSLS